MLGAELRAARRRAGLTQQELAELLGVTREYVGSLERDEDSERVVRLSQALRAVGLRVTVEPLARSGDGDG